MLNYIKYFIFVATWMVLGLCISKAQFTEPRREFRSEKAFSHAIFSQDGQHILVLADTQVLVYHTRTGLLLRRIENGSKINDLVVEPSKKNAVTVDERGDLSFWNIESGQKIKSWNNFNKPIRKLRFSADGQFVATFGAEPGVQIWGVGIGNIVFSLAKNETVHAFDFHPNCQQIVAANASNVITIWDLKTYQPQFILKGHRDSISSLWFSNDGNSLLSTSADKTTRIWNVEKGETTKIYANETKHTVAAFDATGQLVVVGEENGQAKVRDTKSGKLLYMFESKEKITAIGFHPKEPLVFVCYKAPVARTWLLNEAAMILQTVSKKLP